MKTFLIDLDCLTEDVFKSLIGFVLSRGYAFRKIDLVGSAKVGKTLVVEPTLKSEETALKAFLAETGIASPILVDNAGKAKLEGKNIGVFCQVKSTDGLASFWLDKTSGKKFTIQGGV